MMKEAIWVFFIIWPLTQTEFYNSVSVMEVLLHTQEKIIKHIQTYACSITDYRKELIVQKFLSRCRREHELAMWNAEAYLSHPVNSYTLIMRLTRDFEYIQKILNQSSTTGINSEFGIKYETDETLIRPTEEDIYGIVEGLTRLQLLYDLDIPKLANGTITTSFSVKKIRLNEYVTPMTSCNCFELGLVEYEKHGRSKNIAWMKEALRRYDYESDCPINKVEIFDRLSGDYFHIGEIEKSVYWMEKRIETSPYDPDNESYTKAIKLMKAFPEAVRNQKVEKRNIKRDIDYYPVLCLKPYYSLNASLTCYYAHGPHPYLLIAPLKAERLHHSHKLIMFYEVITDADIEDIQRLAKPKLQKAKTVTAFGISEEENCVHQIAKLEDASSNATLRLSQRISQFSGLIVNSNTSDQFHVNSYGLGGYYGPHLDFIRPDRTGKPRGIVPIASSLVYLTDIAEGGATVFTRLRVSVQPVKYAALLWYNLDRWGEDDYNSEHAACPVLVGSRWVINKWISLSGQELIKPCPKTPPPFNKEQPTCSVH